MSGVSFRACGASVPRLRWRSLPVNRWIRHASENLPPVAGLDPRVRDAVCLRRLAMTRLVGPERGHPVVRNDDVLRGLTGRRLDRVPLQPDALVGGRGDPIGNVILPRGLRARGRPADEIAVPQASIAVEV